MPVTEGMEFLKYVTGKEQEDFLVRRWLAPIHSTQNYQSFEEFKRDCTRSGGGKTESSGVILDRVEKMMAGRVVEVNGTV